MTSQFEVTVTIPADVQNGQHLLVATQDYHHMNAGAPARATIHVGTSAPVVPAAPAERTAAVTVSSGPSAVLLGVSFNSDIRQPPGVASADQYAAFGWADTRLGDELTQTQDDFGAIAQLSPLPARTSVLPIVAAVFGGLVVAGIVLLVARRRPGHTPSRLERPEPVGAAE